MCKIKKLDMKLLNQIFGEDIRDNFDSDLSEYVINALNEKEKGKEFKLFLSFKSDHIPALQKWGIDQLIIGASNNIYALKDECYYLVNEITDGKLCNSVCNYCNNDIEEECHYGGLHISYIRKPKHEIFMEALRETKRTIESYRHIIGDEICDDILSKLKPLEVYGQE